MDLVVDVMMIFEGVPLFKLWLYSINRCQRYVGYHQHDRAYEWVRFRGNIDMLAIMNTTEPMTGCFFAEKLTEIIIQILVQKLFSLLVCKPISFLRELTDEK